MNVADRDLLRRLGSGESISSICQAVGIARDDFDRWWVQITESRLPPGDDRRMAGVRSGVEIERDRWGIPHIYAENDADLFFGYGYAMAQDRLFQLDYLRRKGWGTLSEILGKEGLPADLVARTIGLNRIAAARWSRLAEEVRQVVQSFADGVNALIEECGERLPIEFDLLDYRPQPWTPVDCLVIECEFQWYLTGRFPVIVIPELAKRTLGEGPLYEEFILGEADEESILHRGDYTPCADGAMRPVEPVGAAVNDPEEAVGSNHWVIAGLRTTTGGPLLASDPHIAFEAVSCWYEVHLSGGSWNVAGMTYVGMPAVMVGRNERVAWGITNNICSLRDLYQERTDPSHPGCFFYDGRWEPARELEEVINVRGGEAVRKTILFSRNGPVVDDILPPPADQMGPVTLRWLGAVEGGWLTSLLAMDRAGDVEQFREAVRPWHVPTFSLVAADVAGHIAYQASGRIPVRKSPERGYRPGWEPDHQWQGLIPFDTMPHVADPARGWIATANNRLAPDDYPYPLSGCWSSGWRATRIRQWIESRERLSPEDVRALQHDTKSLRAARLVPALIAAISQVDDPHVRQAADYLKAWDFHVEEDSVAAAIFNVFFTHWCGEVAQRRFDAASLELMTGGVSGIAGRLLESDKAGWFSNGECRERIEAAFQRALKELSSRFGPEISAWQWGRLHRMPLKHVLSSRGDLGELLSHGGVGVKGDMMTVCNTGSGPEWTATTGGGYRFFADLKSSPPVLRAVDAQSQSGQPGSGHYRDQLSAWLAGEYHEIPLNRDRGASAASHIQRLLPGEA